MQPEGHISETHFYTDFTMAGQDAYALVASPCVFYGENAKLKH